VAGALACQRWEEVQAMDKSDPGDIVSMKELGEKAGHEVHAEYQKGRVRNFSLLMFSEHIWVNRAFLPVCNKEHVELHILFILLSIRTF
jgi:hypothetical protein